MTSYKRMTTVRHRFYIHKADPARAMRQVVWNRFRCVFGEVEANDIKAWFRSRNDGSASATNEVFTFAPTTSTDPWN